MLKAPQNALHLHMSDLGDVSVTETMDVQWACPWHVGAGNPYAMDYPVCQPYLCRSQDLERMTFE